jgi:hypothetical protein
MDAQMPKPVDDPSGEFEEWKALGHPGSTDRDTAAGFNLRTTYNSFSASRRSVCRWLGVGNFD